MMESSRLTRTVKNMVPGFRRPIGSDGTYWFPVILEQQVTPNASPELRFRLCPWPILEDEASIQRSLRKRSVS